MANLGFQAVGIMILRSCTSASVLQGVCKSPEIEMSASRPS